MPTRRRYSNFPPQQTITTSIGAGDTSLTIAGSFVGWPSQYPFFAVLDYGKSSAEVILVTNIVTTTATVTRGQDGSAALSHASGATLDHCIVAMDLDEANAHTTASSAVHGVTGSVVGDTDTQTLSNKTLSAPIITGGEAVTGGIVTDTITTATQTVTGTQHDEGAATFDAAVTVGGAINANGGLNVAGQAVPVTTCGVTNVAFSSGSATLAIPDPYYPAVARPRTTHLPVVVVSPGQGVGGGLTIGVVGSTGGLAGSGVADDGTHTIKVSLFGIGGSTAYTGSAWVYWIAVFN